MRHTATPMTKDLDYGIGKGSKQKHQIVDADEDGDNVHSADRQHMSGERLRKSSPTEANIEALTEQTHDLHLKVPEFDDCFRLVVYATYALLPIIKLTGRGTVEFTIEKGDGSNFSSTAGGEPKSLETIQVVIDGYSAPLTAGNFAKLVVDGAYNGVKLNFSNQAILSDNGMQKNSGFTVPLELMPSGQFEPLYRTTLSVQDGELPVLPLSVYGAVAMAHNEGSEDFSSPSQFFFYLYDKRNAGLGGLSFEEGQFSVFGYTTVGRDVLPQIKTGDVIRSAKLVEGQDRLILPD
ncbi:hypothetical protein GIB67_025041 [Kingdonia uniflora]|uniref:PPIase cyclophilin-type domain-containing protein n=1 Tax=Kingdonia uniflora TaxID=39325 RepID=A0A7J7N7S2_9MAGN|nr:hypothetical protein GIB67_025041 [Kingdonia uniflora]